jgi:hypothetical protein
MNFLCKKGIWVATAEGRCGTLSVINTKNVTGKDEAIKVRAIKKIILKSTPWIYIKKTCKRGTGLRTCVARKHELFRNVAFLIFIIEAKIFL